MTKILVIDDETALRENIEEILTLHDYDVVTARNGFAAIEVLKTFDPDLILCDIMMPEMNGYEFIKHLRADTKYNDLPLIFLTAKADSDSIIKGFDAGAQDYLSKPFKLKELIARVKTHVELKLHRVELKRMNELLEKKIKERTEELEKSNKQLEIANKQLFELDQLKSEFLSMISHEIRTQLNGIKGPIELLKMKVENKNLVHLIDIIDESASSIERFSSEALEITEIKSNTFSFEKSMHSLDEIIEFAMLEVQNMCSEKNINIEINNGGDIKIYGDKKMLIKCLINILENANRYSNMDGTIEIYCKKSNSAVMIEIRNYGIEFDLKTFDNSINLVSKGGKNIDYNFGLGLIHSQLIVEAHGGTLDIKNLDNGGTSVKINISDS